MPPAKKNVFSQCHWVTSFLVPVAGDSGFGSCTDLAWLSFCVVYLDCSHLGILFCLLSGQDRSLHNPCSYFLAMLSVIDLSLSTHHPKMLGIFRFNLQELCFGCCIYSKSFLSTFFTVMESIVLLAMVLISCGYLQSPRVQHDPHQ